METAVRSIADRKHETQRARKTSQNRLPFPANGFGLATVVGSAREGEGEVSLCSRSVGSVVEEVLEAMVEVGSMAEVMSVVCDVKDEKQSC